MKLNRLSAVALVLSSFALAFQEPAATPAKAPAADADIIAQQLPSYPLTSCPVSHEELGGMGKIVDVVHEGRLVRLCCKSCMKEFKAAPAVTLAMIDAGVVKAQKDSYPLETCVISGEKLGGMGEPVEFVHGTRLVRLCCKSCIKGFQKEPAKFMAPINAGLIAAQKKTYPLTTCPVCNAAIAGEGHDMLYGTRLVRFCSEKCAGPFAKEPAKYLALLDKAPKKN